MVVSIPVPKGIAGASADMSGSKQNQAFDYSVQENKAYWRLKKVPGGTEQLLRLKVRDWESEEEKHELTLLRK